MSNAERNHSNGKHSSTIGVDEVSIITSFPFNFLWLKFVSENTTKRVVELRISAALESLLILFKIYFANY